MGGNFISDLIVIDRDDFNFFISYVLRKKLLAKKKKPVYGKRGGVGKRSSRDDGNY